MFARKVAARLKPNSLLEFTNLMFSEILPWLRTQDGFLDIITLAAPDASEVATITFWKDRTTAHSCDCTHHPRVLRILESVLDSAPYMKTFDVVASTLHRIGPAQQPESNTEPQLEPELEADRVF
jgi:hypothetical protein